MQVSFREEVTERLAAKANELKLRPEEVVEFIVETTLQPSPSEIDWEIEQDPELLASLERSRADIQAGRVFSHEEVLEWHRNHRE
jgi:predicted transcriptional regulator